MKRFTILIIVLLISVGSMASSGDVTLTVTGDGTTKQEAVNNALRSAVEQTYGVFVSSNTQILNDEIVKDEIATITSGNIKKYKELNSLAIQKDRVEVTLLVTVSISNLINYAQSKGASVDFAGNVLANNMNLLKVNTKNERIAINNAIDFIAANIDNCYDKKLDISTPKVNDYDGNVYLPIILYYEPNKNLNKLIKYFSDLLKYLNGVSKSQQITSKRYHLTWAFLKGKYYEKEEQEETYYLLNDVWEYTSKLNDVFKNYFLNFSIKDNLGTFHHFCPQMNRTMMKVRDIPQSERENINWGVYTFHYGYNIMGTQVEKVYFTPTISVNLIIPQKDIDKYNKFEYIRQ